MVTTRICHTPPAILQAAAPPTIGRLQIDGGAAQVGAARHAARRKVGSERLQVEVVADLGVFVQAGIQVQVPVQEGGMRQGGMGPGAWDRR